MSHMSFIFFFSSRRRHTRYWRDWSSDVCSSDLYVVFGGMLATTWVQIIKALLLMSGTIFLSILVLKYFNFSFSEFFDAITKVQVSDPKTREIATKNFLLPGLKFGAAVTKGWGPLDQVSLGLALVFGTAGLPHILVRFYTVPDAKTARVSVVWAMILIGAFYIMTTFLAGLAFAVAASANLPVIVLSIFWRRFNTVGAVAGLAVGLVASIVLIILSPSIMGIDAPDVVAAKRHLIQMAAIFPLTNPGIVSIPLGFLAAVIGTVLTREPSAERQYTELSVRANTGLGAEKATAH